MTTFGKRGQNLLKTTLCTFLTALLLSVGTLTSAEEQLPDYAREKKWADEILPGLVVGDPVYLKTASGVKFLSLYTEPANAKAAVLLVHGRGWHPDYEVVGPIRQGLPDYGYATLSIQAVVLSPAAKFTHYEPLFPDCVERIKAAVEFLEAKGYKKIALVGHSLGSRMVNEYLWRYEENPHLFAWVSIGIVHGTYDKIPHIPVPVLDVYADNDFNFVLWFAEDRRKEIKGVKSKGSRQVMIPNAEHFFVGREKELVATVRGFLDETLALKQAARD
jgi:pimeloyl-ACP methyl ester carboxylesterase